MERLLLQRRFIKPIICLLTFNYIFLMFHEYGVKDHVVEDGYNSDDYMLHLGVNYDTDNSQYKSMKYALVWDLNLTPFDFFNYKGQTPFEINNCSYKNCYLSHEKTHFEDIRRFDAIIFSPVMFFYPKISNIPKTRSARQKYIISTLESTAWFPLQKNYSNFFNWTWSYRLDSDVMWKYITVHNSAGAHVGPNKHMRWQEKFEPTNQFVIEKLRRKTKAVAWVVSNCKSLSKREIYVQELSLALRKYNLSVDEYGRCNNNPCGSRQDCRNLIERDYYFYLSFENSFDEDYVTEKLLTAVQYYTIPIVLGGAEYTRFLPPGSYLNAKKLTATRMATTIYRIFKNFNLYQQYFKWTNHYRYRSDLTSGLCNLCQALNNATKIKTVTIYKDFNKWWTRTKRTDYEFLVPIFRKDDKLLKLLKSNVSRKDVFEFAKNKYFPEKRKR